MRALVVGAGGMGQGWAKTISASDEAELAGWIDVRPGAAQQTATELGLEPAYVGDDLAKAIDDISPDFVVDVTPPEVHHDITVCSLSRGIPVIGEKPMASSMAEARAMVKASDDAGKLYMVSQSRRYDGRLLAYKELVPQIGRMGILNVDFYIGAHFGGFRDKMPSPLVLDMAIHTFDQARVISGADPVAVYAEEFNPSWSWYDGDACATCLFEMSDNLRFTYRGSWCAEGLHSSWEGNWRAVGDKGTAIWDGSDKIVGEVLESANGFHSTMRPIETHSQTIKWGIEGSLLEFLDALRTGKTPQGECHDNIKSLAMVFGALESNKRKQRVDIAEILVG